MVNHSVKEFIMKKIFYSEKLNKNFDTEKECLAAEKEYDNNLLAEQEKKSLTSKRKKELSDNIVEAEKRVDSMYKLYEEAREKARDIISKANQEAEDILRAAANDLEKATEDRMLQIQEFNKEFGPYMTRCTGDKALDEYKKVIRRMRDLFNYMF